MEWTLDESLMKEAIGFFLMVCRASGFLLFLPPLAGTRIPRRVKAGLALLIGALLHLPQMGQDPRIPMETGALVSGIGREVLAGILLSFPVHAGLSMVAAGGRLVDNQLGLDTESLINPATGQASGSTGTLFWISSGMLFLLSDFHVVLFGVFFHRTLSAPTEAVRIGNGMAYLQALIHMFGGAVLIMAPLVLLSLVMTVLLGLMAKALPRSPILFLGFPLRIMMGLVGLILFLPYLMERIAVFLQGSVRLAVGAWQG